MRRRRRQPEHGRHELATGKAIGALPLIQPPAWEVLEAHYRAVRDVHLQALFADDPRRGERLAAEASGVCLDYSKRRVTDETLRLLVQLAGACGLHERIEAMLRGEKINVIEARAVLFVALRAPGHVSPDREGGALKVSSSKRVQG